MNPQRVISFLLKEINLLRLQVEFKGIIRSKIIEEEKVEVRDVLVSEINSFDGAFLTNSVSIISSISSINQFQFKVIENYPISVCRG